MRLILVYNKNLFKLFFKYVRFILNEQNNSDN